MTGHHGSIRKETFLSRQELLNQRVCGLRQQRHAVVKSYLDAEGPPDAPFAVPHTGGLGHQVGGVTTWRGLAPPPGAALTRVCLPTWNPGPEVT